MIERCLWGQEAFGGGLLPPGSVVTDETQTSSTAPWRGLRKGSLRTLGTIESLMILTEWHPRALHFPAPEAIDELMLPSYDRSDPDFAFGEEGGQRPAGVGGKRIESWLEPAWRSDRMCWMLLSTATGLAYELGVFDDIDELLRDGAITRPEYEEETYRQRAYRIKRLLLIYATQLAGRLGWTNMVPESLRKSDPAVSRRRPTAMDGATPGTNPSSLSNAFNYIPDLELDDQIIHCWAGISNVMHIGNEKLFRSRQHTTDIIQSGKYVDLLRNSIPSSGTGTRNSSGSAFPRISDISSLSSTSMSAYTSIRSLSRPSSSVAPVMQATRPLEMGARRGTRRNSLPRPKTILENYPSASWVASVQPTKNTLRRL